MDLLGQQFLEIANERTEQTNRTNVNGIAISPDMGLHHNDYISLIDQLEKEDYVRAPGMNAKDVVLTEKGIHQAKSTASR